MKLVSANITGSLVVNNIDVTEIIVSSSNWSGSLNQRVTNLESTASVLTAASGTLNTRVGSLETTASILTEASGTLNTRVGSLETTASILTAASGTLDTRTTRLESTASILTAASGTLNTRVVSLESTASVLTAASASLNAGLTNVIATTGSFATTGSNTFTGTQYFSNAANANSFTATASFYSDGGMRVTRDMYISGTAYFNNVVVYGTQSINFLTASQLNIATNIITVNTATPTVRFGGLAVYDSGSTGLTGSMLWDSEDNQWIYSNPSGSTYDSAVFLVGPRNSGVLGNEPGINCNFLSKGNGLHHMTSSAIFDDGSRTCFYGNSIVTSTGVGCFSGAVCAASVASAGTITGTTGTFSSYVDGFGIRANNSSAFGNSGVGVELGWNGSLGYVQSYNRSTSAYQPMTVAGCTIALNISGNERFTMFSTGISCFTCTVCAPAFVGGTVSGTTGTFSSTLYAADTITVCNSSAQLNLLSTNCVLSTINLGNVGTVNTSQISYDHGLNRLKVRSNAIDVLTFTNTGVSNFACRVCTPVITAGAGTSSQAIKITGDDNYIEFDNAGTYIKGGGNATFAAASTLFLSTSASTRLTIASTGIATFACTVCAPASIIKGSINEQLVLDFVVGAGSYTHQSFRLCGVNQYRLVGNTNGNFVLRNDIVSSDVLTFACTGIATFACQVCAPIFLASGCVAIGTAGPSTKLHVVNNDNRAYTPTSFNDTSHAFHIQFCNQNQRAGLIRWTSHGNLENSFGIVQVGCSDGGAGCGQGDFIFQAYRTAGSSVYCELMRITSQGCVYFNGGGNVGIGTTTAPTRLTVYTSAGSISGTNDGVRLQVSSYNSEARNTIVWAQDGGSLTLARFGLEYCGATNQMNFVWRDMYCNQATSTEVLRLTGAGHLIPGSNGCQDLGSACRRWCTVYTSDLSLNNGIGNYTIVEGENDLFLYNNNSCKVYKFVVQEVCPEIAPAKRSI